MTAPPYKSHYRVTSISTEHAPTSEIVRRRSSSAAFRNVEMADFRQSDDEDGGTLINTTLNRRYSEFTGKPMSKWSVAEIINSDDIWSPRRRHLSVRLLLLGTVLLSMFGCLGYFFPDKLSQLPRPQMPIAWSSGDVAEDTAILCSVDTAHLAERYSLSSTFEYARRVIIATQASSVKVQSTSSINTINEPLFSGMQKMHADDGGNVDLKYCSQPITLEAPYTPKVDGSHFFFGISTQMARLRNSLPKLQYTLGHTGAKLLVTTGPEEDEQVMRDVATEARSLGIDVTIEKCELGWVRCYFMLWRRMYQLRTPQTEWMVAMDDDTFIPSFSRLVERFRTRYDSSVPTWVGTLSEDFSQVMNIGWMAFGGAGIFLSTPLAGILAEHADECIADANENDGGDYISSSCIMKNSFAKLQLDPDLYQMDVRGNPQGFMESGFRPTTLHHLYTWVWAPPERAIPVATICGQECLYYRYQFDDMMLSNGFSLVQLKKDLDPGLWMSGFEKTWNLETDGPAYRVNRHFEHKFNKLRPMLVEGQDKESFVIEDAVVQEDGSVQQIYIKRGVEGADDKVLELLWLRPQ